jgi:hypothetical protein
MQTMKNRKQQRSKADAANFEVGYGKPPPHTRFKRGQSGNPKGRPKGVRNFKTDLRATLNAPVKLTSDGKPRKVSTQVAILMRLREKALRGDGRALDRYLALAQAYDDGHSVNATSLAAEDAAVLETYRARLLSGSATDIHPGQDRGEGERGASEDN